MSEKNFEPITIPVIGRRNKIKGYCTWSAELLADYINRNMFIKLQACRFKLLDIGMYPINLEKSKMHSMYMSVPKYFRTIRYPDYHYILDAKIHNHHYNILRHQIFKRKKYANIARQQEIKDKQHEPDYKPRYAVWYDKQYRLWQDTDEDFMPKFLLDGWVIPVYDKSDHSVDINNHQHYINGNPTGYVIVEGISSIIDHSWWNMKTIGFVKARVLPVHAIILAQLPLKGL